MVVSFFTLLFVEMLSKKQQKFAELKVFTLCDCNVQKRRKEWNEQNRFDFSGSMSDIEKAAYFWSFMVLYMGNKVDDAYPFTGMVVSFSFIQMNT